VPAAAKSLRAAADAGEAEAAVALAEILVWAEQHSAALAILAEAREQEPKLVRAWLVAAEIERRLGRGGVAADLLRAGLDAAPDLTAGTRERALAAVDRGIETPECLHALGLVMQEAGLPFVPGLVCQLDAGVPRTALDYFAAAVAADGGSRPAAESVARLFELVGLPDLAVPFYETVSRLAPDEAAARGDLRRALWKSYRYEDAAHQARVARALAAQDGGDASPEERARAAREASATPPSRGSRRATSVARGSVSSGRGRRARRMPSASTSCSRWCVRPKSEQAVENVAGHRLPRGHGRWLVAASTKPVQSPRTMGSGRIRRTASSMLTIAPRSKACSISAQLSTSRRWRTLG